MPYLDKSKQAEVTRAAVQRLRVKRRAAGLCSACGQPLTRIKPESAPVVESEPVPVSKASVLPMPSTAGSKACLRCHRLVPRSDLDLYGHCLACR